MKTGDELNKNLGEASVKKLFFQLSIPAVIAQIVNLLYNIVDRIYIGHIPHIGKLALTGVGITMPVIITIAAFSFLIGMGGAPKAAIKMGEGEYGKAEQIMGTCFTALIGIALFLTLGFTLFQEPILYAFGASENTYIYAKEYSSIYVLGSVWVLITLGMNTFIQTQGFATVGMMTTLIGAVINILLDPIFIFVLGLGVKGAALATILSQGVSALWVLRFLRGRRTRLKLRRKFLRIRLKILLSAMGLGASPFIMHFTESILQIVFNRSLYQYGGDLYVGAMTIIATVVQLLFLPLTGFAQGAQPITSFNYGGQRMDRVKESVTVLIQTSMVYTFIFYGLVMIYPRLFIRWFTTDPLLIEKTVGVLRLYASGTLVMGLQISCQQSFIALNQGKISMALALLRKVILLIPLIFILPRFLPDPVRAVFLAEPIADIIAGLTTTTAFILYIKKLQKES